MSDDYTLTTSQVRSAFLALNGRSPRNEEAFDRWLAKHDKDVAAWAVLDYERGGA
jgi:hypothetical protein